MIVITDMTMPSCCRVCQFAEPNFHNGIVTLSCGTRTGVEMFAVDLICRNDRPDWCPLKELSDEKKTGQRRKMSWADALADYLPGYFSVNHERVRVIFVAEEHMNSYNITLLLHNINPTKVYSQFVVTFNDNAIECRSFVTLDGTLAQDHIKLDLDGRVSMVFTIAKSSSEAIDNAIEDIQLVKNTCQRFPWSQTDETPS